MGRQATTGDENMPMAITTAVSFISCRPTESGRADGKSNNGSTASWAA